MIFVIGGIASGKRAFALSLGYDPSEISADPTDTCAVLCDAENLMRDGVPVEELAARIAASKQVVLQTDVGAGIVPIDAGERAWRERAGDLARNLAACADVVVRMTCGIPQVIKGTLPGTRDAQAESAASSAPVSAVAASASTASAPTQPVAPGQPAAPNQPTSPDQLASPDYPAHSFFQNRACKYFPCHEGVPEDEFNCLFCYCPLYALGPACGGNFTYTERGRKNCTGCALPHIRDNGKQLVADHFELLAELAKRMA